MNGNGVGQVYLDGEPVGRTVGAGGLVRQEFGSTAMEARSETASSAMAAYAQATVQARFIMAERRPRNLTHARARVLEQCGRPKFADAAIYHKPVGEGIEGPSIRLAEALVRELGNILVDIVPVLDDREKRIISIVATDLESNATYTDVAVIEKTVERSSSNGYEVLAERLNKKGKRVFIVRATDDDLLNKQAAIVSKKVRTATLRLVPADLLEEALDAANATLLKEATQDLPKLRDRMVANFAALSPPVTAEMLSEYLGHDVKNSSAKEVTDLRKLGAAIKDGEASWAEAMDARRGGKSGEVKAPPPPSAPAATTATAEAPKESTPAGGPEVTSATDAPSSAPDLVEVLLAELQAADSAAAIDAIAKRAPSVPKDHPRRNELGAAINARRKAVKG